MLRAGKGGKPSHAASAVGVSVLGFAILFAYALARPSIESLFLAEHGSEALPLVWIVVAAAMAAAVAIYDRFARRVPLVVLLVGAVLAVTTVLVALAAARAAGLRGATFLLYVWKDVHVVLLLEILWTFANVVFSIREARWLYGVVLACGSLGGITGNVTVGALAGAIGTGAIPWVVVPALLVAGAIGLALGRVVGSPEPPRAAEGERPRVAISRETASYLGWMAALVALVQVAITLVDYQFNVVVEQTIADTDERTAVIGRVYGLVDGGSLALQVLTGPILRLAGVPLTLLAVPALLATAVGAFAIVPRFALMAAAKVASKVLDYSLFKAAKEILYIPLGYAEKTRGKALVDMLTYRVAKGGASLLLLGMVAAGIAGATIALALVVMVLWAAVTVVIAIRWKRLSLRQAAHERGH